MKLRKLATFGGITLGVLGAGLAIHTFLPQRFAIEAPWYEAKKEPVPRLHTSSLPEIDVAFLRCGSITLPEAIAVRGASPLALCVITYSAVLVRHPQATFAILRRRFYMIQGCVPIFPRILRINHCLYASCSVALSLSNR